jgi:monoamine oxidase
VTRVPRPDAVVIGAGLSGLTTALTLQERGLDVQVIEARRRVGGRLRSVPAAGGTLESGGATVGAGYRRVLAAAARHGVGLVDATPLLRFFREQELVLDGRLIGRTEWPDHPANPFPDRYRDLMPWNLARVLTVRENPLEEPAAWLDPSHAGADVSLRAWMTGLGCSEAAIRIGYDLNPAFGRDAADVSALLLFFRAAFSAGQRRAAPDGVVGLNLEGGAARLPERMATSLGRGVHFGREVRRIEDDGREVTVGCADGTAYRAARVVCSLPFPVLRHVAMDPPLRGLQEEAVRGLPSQPVTQLHFGARSPFWEADGLAPSLYTDGPAGMFAAARPDTASTEVTGFTAWVMGNQARRLDALPAREAAALVVRQIETVRPAARDQLEFIGQKSWGADPFARGAWACFRPGQVRRFGVAMRVAHGRVHFCGEHLAEASRGMEGAMESGERVAREVFEGN